MQMPGRSGTTESYRFGYQGQFAEKDFETGYNQFEARLYDARIGRWMIPDPAGQFHSPYLGMGNNPVRYVDPDGECAWLVFGLGYALYYGGLAALEANWQGEDFWIDGYYKAAIAGFAIGAISVGTGSLFTNIYGITLGTTTGAIIGGLTNGTTSGLLTASMGGDFIDGFKQGAITGAIFGGIMGGISGGIRATKSGANIFSGIITSECTLEDIINTSMYTADIDNPVTQNLPGNDELGKWEHVAGTPKGYEIDLNSNKFIGKNGPVVGVTLYDLNTNSGKIYTSPLANSDALLFKATFEHELIHVFHYTKGLHKQFDAYWFEQYSEHTSHRHSYNVFQPYIHQSTNYKEWSQQFYIQWHDVYPHNNDLFYNPFFK